MTDTTTEKKVHWATRRRLDREAAKAEGREPPPWPIRKLSKATLTNARIEAKIEKDKKQLADPSTSAQNFLEGLTSKTCCNACTPECCVITGRQFVRFKNEGPEVEKGELKVTYTTGYTTSCGHPYKGGLQAKHKMMPDVMNRYAKAEAYLEHQKIDRKAG